MFLDVDILLAGRESDMFDFPKCSGSLSTNQRSVTGTTACWVLKTVEYPVRGAQ